VIKFAGTDRFARQLPEIVWQMNAPLELRAALAAKVTGEVIEIVEDKGLTGELPEIAEARRVPDWSCR
jgi:hypothetical protein